MSVSDLARQWRSRAEDLRRWAAAEGPASAYERAAAELEEALDAAANELLSPTEAARVSGLSERTLRDRRARGALTDHGAPGRPLYRRGDLPVREGAPGPWNVSEHVAGILGAS